MDVRSDRWYDFPATPPEVWAAFSDPARYRSWWPWLDDFTGSDLRPGARWRCAVSPPLPYVVRFSLHLDEVEPPRRIRATVAGDITGWAELELEGQGSGCRLHLVSALAPRHPVLRAVANVARPVVHRGHDWVLDTGARQFAEQAL